MIDSSGEQGEMCYSLFAIETASTAIYPGNVVLLSPGAASFSMFKDEFDRGTQFKDIVNSL
jgi:UDP-N-acetylmuramoylalanine--D-glutamate ligase